MTSMHKADVLKIHGNNSKIKKFTNFKKFSNFDLYLKKHLNGIKNIKSIILSSTNIYL